MARAQRSNRRRQRHPVKQPEIPKRDWWALAERLLRLGEPIAKIVAVFWMPKG